MYLVNEPLPDDVLGKLLSLVPSGNIALDHNAIQAVKTCVTDHFQSLSEISIRVLCDLVTNKDTHRGVSHDAMMSLLALAEQGTMFEPQHTARLVEFLSDRSVRSELRNLASKWLFCIILTRHEISDTSVDLIHAICLCTQPNVHTITENCLFALDFLSNYRKLSAKIVSTIRSSNLLRVFRQRQDYDKYDRNTLQQLLSTLNSLPNDRQNVTEKQNLLCAVTRLIQLNTGTFEEKTATSIESAFSRYTSYIHRGAVNELRSELNRHRKNDRQESAIREFDAANTKIQIRAELTATNTQAVKVMHGNKETDIKDISQEETETSKESEHGKETNPDINQEGNNWNWWRTTHSQLEKYEGMIKNNHELTQDDIEYIGKKMFGCRSSLQFFNAQQEMEKVISWLLAALAKQGIPLPMLVKDKVQKYITGKTEFAPENTDEYNQQMILILNKFVEQGSGIDTETVTAIETSFTKYPETILLLDNIVGHHPVKVKGLENKILDKNKETCQKTCRLFFEASK